MAKPVIYDAWGKPIERAALTQEVAAPRVGSMLSPAAGYPADGLNPMRLAAILRAADLGEPRQFLELAETIEERDPHYHGVMAVRKRSVAGLDITVEAGSSDPEDERIAQMVRDYIDRDELSGELFAILDCLGKGYSGTEVVYELSEGQYRPRLIPRDPRIFRFDRNDLETPMRFNGSGQLLPLEPGHFIWATIKAKSGLAVRSGLARVAAWGWMFKMFTQRDWAIFTQTYGQPVRIGKFATGASQEDKDTLYNAVANIAGDCAAIIPESMTMEFIEAGNVGAAHQLYKERCDWLDQQISKAVLGQTSTTDAVVGGLGSGKEHREVQQDIEKADAKALAAILNRDLIRVWVQLEFGPRKVYPRIRIGRSEQEDLKALAEALVPFIDRGMEVDMADLRERFSLPEPKADAKLMRPQSANAVPPVPGEPKSIIKREPAVFKRVEPQTGVQAHLQAEDALAGKKSGVSPETALTDRMMAETAAPMGAIMAKVEAMVGAATSFDELRQMLAEGFPDIDVTGLADVLGMGLLAAHAGGRVAAHEVDE